MTDDLLLESARITAELKLGVAVHRVTMLGGTVTGSGPTLTVIWDDDEVAS